MRTLFISEKYIKENSVIDENKFWDVLDELKDAGAEGILIVPISKMVVL